MSIIKKSRIPIIPLSSKDSNKAIDGEILVDPINKKIQVLYNNQLIDLTDNAISNSDILKTGIVNLIKGTAFNDSTIPNNFTSNGLVLLTQESGSLGMSFYNSESKVIIELNESIEKNKKYTISFYAESSNNVNMVIAIDYLTYAYFDITPDKKYYSFTFDTSSLSTDTANRLYISVNDRCKINISKLMFEYGSIANDWIETSSYNLTINKLFVSNIDVLDCLTIQGQPLTSILAGNTNNLMATADEIITSEDYIETQSIDANYDTVSVQLGYGENEVICNKTFNNLLYGTYYVILRIKTTSNTCEDHPLLNITTSEYIDETDSLTLLSSTDIYETDFSKVNEFEEIGFITQFKGINGKNTKNLNITINMIGNENNPKINIDYISIGMAAPGIVPLFSSYE